MNGKQTRKALYALAADELVNALESFQLPYVDGQSIIAEPALRMAQGKAHKTPFLTGGNSNEGSVLGGSGISVQTVSAAFSLWRSELEIAYTSDFEMGHQAGWQRVFGDARYLLAASVQGEMQANLGAPTYLYYIDFVPAARRNEWLGTPHGMDAYLLFNGAQSEDESVRAFSRMLRRYWLNFARTGNPNGVLAGRKTATEAPLPQWPAYKRRAPHWLVLSHNTESRKALLKEKLDLLRAQYAARTAPALVPTR